jgi:hypothetical protein
VKREQLIGAFSALGTVLKGLAEQAPCPAVLTNAEYEQLQAMIAKEQHYNGWFTPETIRQAMAELASFLNPEALHTWLEAYPQAETPKTIAVIMPGNLPLVGFHDFLCVLCAGHKVLVKLSSEDARLLPALAQVLLTFEPDLQARIAFAAGKITGYDAVIATGSDNALAHFKQYFTKVPHLFRGHRTSVAVLDGTESQEALFRLGFDIFRYFGRGCRNVTHLIVPQDFELNRFFEAIVPYGDIIHHKKYGNNYDYNKAVHLLNLSPILDNNFVLLKESEQLFAPLSMLHYHRSESPEATTAFLAQHEASIQCVVGHAYLDFGQAQCPRLDDYADGIDTMHFLGTFAICHS